MTTEKTYGELQAYMKWFKVWNYTTMSHKQPKEVLQAEYDKIMAYREQQKQASPTQLQELARAWEKEQGINA